MNPSEGSEPEAIDVRVLVQGEEALLARVAPGVFDRPVDLDLLREFLADPRHHLAVAIETGAEDPLVVGMATAVDYLHPDKPAELWIDEVGVAPQRRGRGLGRRLLAALFEVGRRRGSVRRGYSPRPGTGRPEHCSGRSAASNQPENRSCRSSL